MSPGAGSLCASRQARLPAAEAAIVVPTGRGHTLRPAARGVGRRSACAPTQGAQARPRDAATAARRAWRAHPIAPRARGGLMCRSGHLGRASTPVAQSSSIVAAVRNTPVTISASRMRDAETRISEDTTGAGARTAARSCAATPCASTASRLASPSRRSASTTFCHTAATVNSSGTRATTRRCASAATPPRRHVRKVASVTRPVSSNRASPASLALQPSRFDAAGAPGGGGVDSLPFAGTIDRPDPFFATRQVLPMGSNR